MYVSVVPTETSSIFVYHSCILYKFINLGFSGYVKKFHTLQTLIRLLLRSSLIWVYTVCPVILCPNISCETGNNNAGLLSLQVCQSVFINLSLGDVIMTDHNKLIDR